MERFYWVIWGNVGGIAQYSWQCNLFYNCIATKWLVSGHRRLCCSVTSSLHLYFGQNKELQGTAAFLLLLHAVFCYYIIYVVKKLYHTVIHLAFQYLNVFESKKCEVVVKHAENIFKIPQSKHMTKFFTNPKKMSKIMLFNSIF